MGKKYFRGERDQLKEYNIATEVFGRPASIFNPTDDAIARVEAHRLRKRLKEYYEAEGKDHSVHITIPLGTYVPVFTHRTGSMETVSPAEEAPPAQANAPLPGTENIEPLQVGQVVPIWRRRAWIYVVVAAALLAAVLGIRHLRRPQAAVVPEPTSQSKAGAALPENTFASAVSVPLLLMAGYSGVPHVDSSGAVWGADRYFQGKAFKPRRFFTGRTARPLLFEQWRSGEFPTISL